MGYETKHNEDLGFLVEEDRIIYLGEFGIINVQKPDLSSYKDSILPEGIIYKSDNIIVAYYEPNPEEIRYI